MSQAVKRACDACHRRKVKCDGINPCRNCSSAQLSCTYNAIPQKKGPKGSRAKVISELRETQRQTSLAAKVQNRINGIACSPTNTALTPTPGLLTSDLVKDCVSFFFEHMYTQLPILERRSVEQQILFMEQNRDAYCLMTSLCAFVMLQPGMNMPPGDAYNLDMVAGANIVASQLLVEETVRVRKGYEYLDSISHNALATNFFLFACHNGQEMHDKAWYYLREATTLIHMGNMHKEEFYMQFEPADGARRRRLFWLLFATERAYALQRNRPLTLQPSISLPTINDDPSDPLGHQLSGFVLLANLFKPFDDTFISVWNKIRGNMSAQWLSTLQKQLSELNQSYSCQDPNFSDAHINQQWLKSTVWQLTDGLVNSGNDDSFQYPVNVARDLLMSMASQFPNPSIDVFNSGLVEKLMSIASTSTEYLGNQPTPRDPFAQSPRDNLQYIFTIIAMSRNGDHRFLPLLLSRMSEILPGFTKPMLQNPPENHTMANVDMFDGFGSAGMAQGSVPMQLSIDTDYDRKYTVEEYDKKWEMNNGTPESSNSQNMQQGSDMNGSFVGSPGLVSPTMEYPGMNSFACTPMTDMVMSPIGTQPNPMSGSQPQQHHQMNRSYHMGMQQTSLPSHPMNNMCSMPAPPRPSSQRQSSFHLQAPPPMRTVSDFQGMQNSRPDVGMVGMGSMGSEIDFGALR